MSQAILFPNSVPERGTFHRTSQAIGAEFEHVIELSARQCSRMALMQLPRSGAQWIGPGKYIPKQMPCDFVGVIAGLPFFFDAKSNQGANAFKGWNDEKILKQHQRDFLISMGRAGAVSGILAESTSTARVFWMPWQLLLSYTPSISWDDPLLYLVDYVRLGQVIRFQSLVGWALMNAGR